MANEIEIRLPVDLQSSIFRDWGLHFKRYQLLVPATSQFQRSRQCKENARSIIELCKCCIEIGAYAEALKYAEQCIELYPEMKEAVDLRRDCIYFLNQLEEAARHSHNIARSHPKDHLSKPFAEVLALNIRNATSTRAGPVLRRFAWNQSKEKSGAAGGEAEDTMNTEKCDVVSDDEEEAVEISPLAQRKLDIQNANRHKYYFDCDISNQIDFWSDVLNNRTHILSQFPESSDQLTKIIEASLREFNANEQNLWARNPLFSRPTVDRAHQNRFRRIDIFHLQDIARRKAFIQLIQLKKLSKECPRKTIDYVEQIMTKFYAITPESIMPRRSEFINEIYGIVGMAVLRRIIEIPHTVMTLAPLARLLCLLQIKEKKADGGVSNKAVFGDQQAYQNTILREQAMDRSTKRCDHYQKRLRQSDAPIEKAYLQYQIAGLHFGQQRLGEAIIYGEGTVAAAQLDQNLLWEFLGHIVIMRTQVLRQNYVRVRSYANELMSVAEQLDKYVMKFVEVIKYLASDLVDAKEPSIN